MNMPLVLLNRRRRAGGFNPVSALFSASEPGGLWLPEPQYLFQDRAGTTPVTAAGQSVGLRLDMSRGLTLGAELVAAGWTADAGWVQSDRTFTATSVAANTEVEKASLVTAGKTYQVEITWSGLSALSAWRFYLFQFTTAVDISNTADGASGSRTYRVQAPSSGTITALRALNASQSGVFTLSIRELPGNHLVAINDAARGTYNTDGTLHWIAYDGVNSGYVSPTITPGTDKAQVFAGVRKLSDAAFGMIAELSTGATVDGVFYLGNQTTGILQFFSRGTVNAFADGPTAFPAPVSLVTSGLGDISGDSASIRINGVLRETVTTDQGTGNYLAYPLYVGRRGGTSLPFNGRDYGILVRFGPNLDADTITKTERYIAARTGVTL